MTINFTSLTKLINKDLPTVSKVLSNQVLTRNPVAKELTLPKYLKLDTNPIAWSTKDRIIRNMSYLEKQSKPGIIKPIGYYRLNTKMDLAIGSSDSRQILKAMVKAPDDILRCPLRVVAHIKHNQWETTAQVYGVTHIIFAAATGYAIVDIESWEQVTFVIYGFCGMYLALTFLELFGSEFSKPVIWKSMWNLLCIVAAGISTAGAEEVTETLNWFRALAIALITVNGIGKLDTIGYMRYTIEMVRQVVIDLIPTAIFMLMFCASTALMN